MPLWREDMVCSIIITATAATAGEHVELAVSLPQCYRGLWRHPCPWQRCTEQSDWHS